MPCKNSNIFLKEEEIQLALKAGTGSTELNKYVQKVLIDGEYHYEIGLSDNRMSDACFKNFNETQGGF